VLSGRGAPITFWKEDMDIEYGASMKLPNL